MSISYPIPTVRPAALLAMQSAVIAMAIPSLHLSHAGTLSRRMNLGSGGLHCEVAKTVHSTSFLSDTNNGWGVFAFHLKFALEVTHPPEMRRL